jgi:hypothetical protein
MRQCDQVIHVPMYNLNSFPPNIICYLT